jgi:hypothetical protein
MVEGTANQMMMEAWWLASSVPAAIVFVSFEQARDSKPGRFPKVFISMPLSK